MRVTAATVGQVNTGVGAQVTDAELFSRVSKFTLARGEGPYASQWYKV